MLVFATVLALMTLAFGTAFADTDPLTLMSSKRKPTDLALSGKIVGLESGEKRYITYENLLSFPEVTIIDDTLADMTGEHELTVLPFSALWKRLPIAVEADAIIVDCADGWKTTYTQALVERFEPYIVLKVDGLPPSRFPLKNSIREHFFPYLIDVSYKEHPEYYTGEKGWIGLNPASSVELRAINYSDYYSVYFDPPFQSLTINSSAYRGRAYFMLNCMPCHPGPNRIGGAKSDRPFTVLQAIATYNPLHFRAYLKDPSKLNPQSRMTPFSHMSDEQTSDLIAFLSSAMN